jgi:hypothetical protein
MGMSELYSSWQAARERFNHDWLKNQYIPALESFRNILKGQVQRADHEQDFWEVDLPQWETNRSEAGSLIREFEAAMSPRVLFDEIPLCGCNEEIKDGVGRLVHRLWSTRLSVPDLIKRAAECLEATDKAYKELKADLKENPSGGINRTMVQHFEEFRNACHALAGAFEQFPSRVRVV